MATQSKTEMKNLSTNERQQLGFSLTVLRYLELFKPTLKIDMKKTHMKNAVVHALNALGFEMNKYDMHINMSALSDPNSIELINCRPAFNKAGVKKVINAIEIEHKLNSPKAKKEFGNNGFFLSQQFEDALKSYIPKTKAQIQREELEELRAFKAATLANQ